jgi:hypothetical protein
VRGSTSFLYSLRWIHPLRPARYLVSALRRQGLSRNAAAVLGPMARVFDALTMSTVRRVLGGERVHLSGGHLDDQTLADGIREFSGTAALRPDYDEKALAWLLTRLADKRDHGTLQRVAVRNGDGELVGWYLYYLWPGETSEVVQIAGRRRWLGDVLEHLLSHARAGGAAAVSGRLDPPLVPACVAKQCFYRAGGSWMLVDSRDRDILAAIHQGDAFFTRLEGEWWIGYGGDSTSLPRRP